MSKTVVCIFHCKPWAKDLFDFAKSLFDDNQYELRFYSRNNLKEVISSIEDNSVLLFLHWNWIVPKKIIDKFKCICFHMTDLPFGRGGSPLQNLILNGLSETKISALLMTSVLDGGPIYLKRPIKLNGSALKIFKRAGYVSLIMAKEILEKNIQPIEQVGSPTLFSRLTSKHNELPPKLQKPSDFYDRVRMVDAPSYPSSYIIRGNIKIKFINALMEDGKVSGIYEVEEEKNDY